LGIRTIGSSDGNKATRKRLAKARRKERDRLRKASKRRAKGVTPRAVYEANSLSRTKPWVQLGISRAKYYRLPPEQRVETSVSPHPSYVRADALVSHDETAPQNRRTRVAKPPAIAFGTPSQISHIGIVDAEGVVGDPDGDRRRKTRFPTAMRLTKEMKAFPLEAGYEPERIASMWEMFRDHNISQRNYSYDWTDTWFNWVNRQTEFDIEEDHRQRAQVWLERRTTA
jgi:hypothetical protein